MMDQTGRRLVHKKKVAQSLVVIDTDQDASAHPIDPTDLATSEVVVTLLPIAQRVSAALIETAVDARSEAATEEAVTENANEMANRDQDESPARAADVSVALVTTDEHQEERTNATGGAVAAEAVEEQMMVARGVAIPRIKAMEKQRGGVSSALSAL